MGFVESSLSHSVGGTAVNLEDAAGGIARSAAGEKEGRADDLVGLPARFKGTSRSIAACISLGHALAMSVRKAPGMMQLTRTSGAKARARLLVRLCSPDLAAPYGISAEVGCKSPASGFVLDFLGEGPAGFFLATGNHHVHTTAGESENHLFAQAATASGDEGDLVSESKLMRRIGELGHAAPKDCQARCGSGE